MSGQRPVEPSRIVETEESYGWMVVGALYALGCDPIAPVIHAIVRDVRNGYRGRLAIEAAKRAREGHRVHAVLDVLRHDV